ncbi:MAG: hypothetical protein A3I07_03340 [Candidatus Doudnabacteria bacterium RIFCSPLOWO2_02_FULL_42_9]|uniref:RNA polymerase sigma factor n=1 Tax=Candidatus Doudnabacteria bacterium RIFCSPHIGHO2_01_FULL_41_86 TaxID=1817821 RepID=A0A1F5N7W3_9BACT|nr:MAG: hypothetical protein A2717_03920 [Candidatus Doudnabacteria bacterium RIFCSPHIGHO2_01_FULL_41_86]OGE74930.1 MAG: hypothetical protein A3K07_02445 [Candidatus Doudnabacteria bacterium RIFCSPHIGHO2_01_43_10]OGE85782.1 MAG: hypothetical protein A3E28_03250 [Candidatus Doudnabacteria bacterium RIFCSPHIGHO2_12_FULL_42_22]OGE87277.1 MAG: hypothetical protein A3C49_00875 [Candidatus Doudnabacteria bacterium RIFCSPHIGHO2_02_FULL_42_25]OGE92114.1 MAG: hypothetical protein A2895_00750 [Candidatus
MKEELLKDIFKKAQSGDDEAFGLIYDHFAGKIYKFIFFRVSHTQVAEDILADTFIKGWQKLTQVNSPAALSAWLYQIAKNNIIDYYRIKKDSVDLAEVENFLEDETDIVDEANLTIDQQKILVLIEELPEEQKQIIKYKFLEELENEEIAYITGKSEGAIRVIQHRAISKLKELLNKKYAQ